jgi:hypothetical protein
MCNELENLMDTSNLDEVVFTVCSLNYLDKAVVMLNSVVDEVKKIIVVVDKKKNIDCDLSGIAMIFAEDLNIPRYDEASFKYNVIEMNTCIKPFVCKFLLKYYAKVVYLDPDILVFNSLSVVIDELDEASFVITPHALCSPADSLRPSDQDFLRFGLYNLGFFGATREAVESGLLDWWHNKLIEECFYEPSSGFGVDQKFVDLIPVYFENVKILRNKGLNVAFWNLHERNIVLSDDGYFAGSSPIIFVHFSSYAGIDIVAKKQSRFVSGSRQDFLDLLVLYKEKIDSVLPEIKAVSVCNSNYSYDFLSDGMYVTPLARRAYYHRLKVDRSLSKDPFANKELLSELDAKGFFIKSKGSIPHFNFNEIKEDDFRVILISKLLIVLRKVLGPVRYYAFCRYIGHISNTLNQRDIL